MGTGLLTVLLLHACVLVSSNSSWYPKYHLAPPKGWMNDPNGLSFFDGYYQAFFQYNPDSPLPGGLIRWGHARSTDLLHWEHLPIALEPSIPSLDIDGIFSGSAVVNDTGNLTLMYTGVSGEHQSQCIATSADGVVFEKLGQVIKKDGNDSNFRDPKVWRQGDSWFVIIGSQNSGGKGEVLLYKSADLFNWESQGVLLEADDKLGYMWECPDFFTLDGKEILIINPQGVQQEGYDYQNLYQTGYFVGEWAPGGTYNVEKDFREIDHGHDFYASQTFLAPDGRRILIAWMDMWESVFPESAQGWSCMLTLPRELSLSESGDLQVRPVREAQQMRKMGSLKKGDPIVLSGTTYAHYEVEESIISKEILIEFDMTVSNASRFGLIINRVEDNIYDDGVMVYVNSTERRLVLERQYEIHNISRSSRSVPIDLEAPVLSLNIFVDASSIEVFVNNGQAVLSSRIYPDDDQRALSFFLQNGSFTISRYESWDL